MHISIDENNIISIKSYSKKTALVTSVENFLQAAYEYYEISNEELIRWFYELKEQFLSIEDEVNKITFGNTAYNIKSIYKENGEKLKMILLDTMKNEISY